MEGPAIEKTTYLAKEGFNAFFGNTVRYRLIDVAQYS